MEIKSLHKIYPDKKLKIAAYARISNDKESSETSLEEQVDYYTRIIVASPNWEFAGIYYDDGISGTTTTQRKGFINMIENARSGLIDIILVKSISRFARNIIDLLTIVRELRNKGIEIYFESQNISSLDTKCDQMITMFAEFAQEEALSVSQNVKWRVEKNIRDGKYRLPVKQMLGYRYDEKDRVVIYEPEAEIVRKMYSLYLKGMGCIELVKYLKEHNIPNRQGIVHWTGNVVRGILRNEKYVGDYLYHKSYVNDPLTHQCKLNHGEIEQFIVRNGHPAIIDRKSWDKVQVMMDENAKRFRVPSYENGNFNPATLVNPMIGFIKCPYCGKNYISKLNHYNGEVSNRHYMCSQNRYTKTCKSDNYPAKVFEKIMLKQIKILKSNLPLLKEALYESFSDSQKESRDQEIDVLNSQIEKLKQDYALIEKYYDDFYVSKKKQITSEIAELTKKKLILQNELLTAESVETRVDKILKAIKKVPADAESIEGIDFKEIFTNAVIVNKKLIYFIIGDSVDKYPLKPNLRFKGDIKYRIRIADFNTSFGILINR